MAAMQLMAVWFMMAVRMWASKGAGPPVRTGGPAGIRRKNLTPERGGLASEPILNDE